MLTNLYNSLDDNANEKMISVGKSIETLGKRVLDDMLQQLEQQSMVIQIYDNKNIPQELYSNITRIDLNPFSDIYENIRFSPIVYKNEVNEHETFAKKNIVSSYELHSTGEIDIFNMNADFYIPVVNSNPIFFDDSVFGVDLYNITNTKTKFFDKITSVDNFYISESFPFFGSLNNEDLGIYIGNIVTSNNCSYINKSSFNNLIINNKKSNCIYGFTYYAFIMRNFFNNLLDSIELRDIDNINKESIKFVISDDRTNSIIYRSTTTIDKAFGHININITKFTNNGIRIIAYFCDIYDDSIRDEIIYTYVILSVSCVFVLSTLNIVYWLQRHKLEILTEQKQNLDTMVSYVNHELRNPLMILNGHIELAIKSIEKYIMKLDNNDIAFDINFLKKILKNLKIAQSSNKMLSTIVNDILDIQKLEKKSLELTKKVFTVGDIVDNITYALKHKIDEFASVITYKTNIFNPNYQMYNDDNKICQIIINFLINAYNFTERGSIIFSIMKETDDIIFSVSDTGPGIEKSLYDKIFAKKYVGHRTAKSIRGTGLGLYLCNLMAQLLDASITCNTEIGKGSVFSIRIKDKKEEHVEIH